MESKEIIEQRVWAFLDGSLTPEESRLVRQRIEAEQAWNQIYEEALELNSSLRQLPLDSPPVTFVSDVLSRLPARGPIKKRSPVVFGIFLFFLAAVAYVLIRSFTQRESEIVQPGSPASANGGFFSISNFFSNESTVHFLIGVNILLILFLADMVLNKRNPFSAGGPV